MDNYKFEYILGSGDQINIIFRRLKLYSKNYFLKEIQFIISKNGLSCFSPYGK